MPAGNDIPSEVLIKIFALLCPSEFTPLPLPRNSTALALSRVCSQWRSTANDFLFQRFRIRFYKDDFGQQVYNKPSFRKDGTDSGDEDEDEDDGDEDEDDDDDDDDDEEEEEEEEDDQVLEGRFRSWEKRVMDWIGQHPPSTLWIDFVFIVRGPYDAVGDTQLDLFASMMSELVKNLKLHKLILSLPNGDPYNIIKSVSDHNREVIEEVTIYPSFAGPNAEGRAAVPLNNLKCLRTNGMYMPFVEHKELPFPLTFQSITAIEILELPVDITVCLTALVQCGASLERLVALLAYDSELEPDHALPVVKLPLLRTLSLHLLPLRHCSVMDTAEILLDQLEVPALEVFKIRNPSDPQSKVPSAILRLWNRSGKPEIRWLYTAVKGADIQCLKEICTPAYWERGLWPVHIIFDYNGP